MTSSNNHLKDAAVSFLKLVTAGRIREAYEKNVSPLMRHHNVFCKGDAKSLETAMEENHIQFPHKVIDIKHVLSDGELVAVHSHIRLDANHAGFGVMHLFRFENGLIAEIWDLGQPIPERSPNELGMF